MKIGIDARLINETGVGRYIRNLLFFLAKIDTTNQYVIFLPAQMYESFRLPNPRWEKRLLNVHWHTIREQVLLPFIFYKEKLDVLHVPYFTVPLFYPGTIITTIHDITILHFKTGKATTLPFALYYLKWLAYTWILKLGIKKSKKILTVSQTVKKELQEYFKIPSEKITVAYEGIDPIFSDKAEEKVEIQDEYFLYVGNVYPHKNAEMLLRSYKRFIEDSSNIKKIKLIFVGKQDFFYRRLKETVKELVLTNEIIFMHDITDEKLKYLYKHAQALLFPSLSEGFGLPALEALSVQCQVICSDLPVFHELFEDYATYVANDERQWAKALKKLQKKDRPVLKDFLQKYSWEQLATITKQAYESSLSI